MMTSELDDCPTGEAVAPKWTPSQSLSSTEEQLTQNSSRYDVSDDAAKANLGT